MNIEQFINDVIKTIKLVLWKKFPHIPAEEKDDISQEVELKIWKMISCGKKITYLKSYLWKVVYTTALDVLDERQAFQSLEESMEFNVTNPISGYLPDASDKIMEKKEQHALIENAIDSLAQNRRIVLKLHLAGYHVDDIAEFLGWTVSKTNHLYYRGLKDLKKILNKPGKSIK